MFFKKISPKELTHIITGVIISLGDEEGGYMREYLKHLRRKSNLTQQAIAGKLLISQNYYSAIENGERQQRMDVDLIQKLANVFGVPVYGLIDIDCNSGNHKIHKKVVPPNSQLSRHYFYVVM